MYKCCNGAQRERGGDRLRPAYIFRPGPQKHTTIFMTAVAEQ